MSGFGAPDLAFAVVASATLLSGFAVPALARAASARMLSGFRKALFLALARATSARMSSGFDAAALASTLAASAVLASGFAASGAAVSAAGTTEGASPTDVSAGSIFGSILGDSSLAMACGPDGKIHPSVTFRNYQVVTGLLRWRGKFASTLQESVTAALRADRRSRTVAGQNRHVIAERQQLGLDPGDELIVAPIGKIGAADRAGEQ